MTGEVARTITRYQEAIRRNAAEIEQLRRELAEMVAIKDAHQEKRHEFHERAEAAEAEVAKLREALEFYATAGDDGQWEYGEWVTKLTQDGGSRARDTLRRVAALAQPKEGQADPGGEAGE